jgi:hypothetical protein
MAENAPFFDHANVLLQRLCNGATLEGNYPGERRLRRERSFASMNPSTQVTPRCLIPTRIF